MDSFITSVGSWMKLVSEYGLPLLFLACVMGLLLYVALIAVGLLKKWIPKWFESSIASHDRVAKAVENQCKILDNIHDHTHATKVAATHSIQAAKSYPDVPNEALVHLNSAENALKDHDNDHA